jgi:RNA polymerase sigma-70 factor, ECF subfamily
MRSRFLSNTLARRAVLLSEADDCGREEDHPPGEVVPTLDAERQVFLELVDRHGAAVLAMLRRLCGNVHDADDIFQEVATRVWRNLHSRPRLRSPKAWLLTVAYRQFLDHRARWPVHASLSGHDPPERDWSAIDPAALAERSDEARLLDQAVEDLPETLRSVVILHYTGGLSLRETAEALGISTGTAKSRLNSGLEQLRRRLS